MEAVLFIGIQASGKSTFFKQRFFDTHVRINLDMLRTRHREDVLLRTCLQIGQRFVIDRTNPTKIGRQRFIAEAKSFGFRVVGYYFPASLEDCQRRNAARPGKQAIPPAALVACQDRLEPPELAEGFDELFAVGIGPDSAFVVQPWGRQ